MTNNEFDRILPIAVGVGLVGLGAALLRTKPGMLALPDPAPIADDSQPNMLVSSAHNLRDGIARFTPDNFATSLSRSFIITGAALVLVRLLDEVTGRSAR
ncbi:hypothetical protein ACJ5NV_01770 [Loktanella agnita]|uniref:hypothetical protein n=1 Tax=Loktanella agnita TaxID=287097 RepID=UPI00398648C5